MKYLICLEGKFNKIIEGEEEKNKYLEQEAKERKQFGCLNVDKWLNEMLNYGFSHIYTVYPEIVIMLDE